MITTSLAAICAANPCGSGIRRLLTHIGKTMADARGDETPLPVLVVLESSDIGDALWVLDRVVGDKRVCRLFAADCAERVHHLFAAELPDDDRPMAAIRAARDPNATPEQLAAARDAALAAAEAARDAARDAAWDAARSAARSAAWAVSWAVAWDAALVAAGDAAWAAARAAAWAAAAGGAVGDAAWDAARSAARSAAWAVSWAAARAAAAGGAVGDAAWDAAWAAAWAAQKARLAQYLTHGEAAAAMPWPEQIAA